MWQNETWDTKTLSLIKWIRSECGADAIVPNETYDRVEPNGLILLWRESRIVGPCRLLEMEATTDHGLVFD